MSYLNCVTFPPPAPLTWHPVCNTHQGFQGGLWAPYRHRKLDLPHQLPGSLATAPVRLHTFMRLSHAGILVGTTPNPVRQKPYFVLLDPASGLVFVVPSRAEWCVAPFFLFRRQLLPRPQLALPACRFDLVCGLILPFAASWCLLIGQGTALAASAPQYSGEHTSFAIP